MVDQAVTTDQNNTDVGGVQAPVVPEVTAPVAPVVEPVVAEPTAPVVPEVPVVEGAPEAYADFNFSEGYNVDTAIMEKFTELAKGLDLTQEDAQKVMDLAVENMANAQKIQEQAWLKQRDDWVKDIKADKDFGGEKFNETMERAKRSVANFFGDDVLKFLDATGYGDHPGLLKGLAKIDMAVGEDKFVDGRPSEQMKSVADRIFGTK